MCGKTEHEEVIRSIRSNVLRDLRKKPVGLGQIYADVPKAKNLAHVRDIWPPVEWMCYAN